MGVVRGPSRVHGGALTSIFGPARLFGDGLVCDMALARLSCARFGDGDVARAAVVGAAQMAPRRLRGPHVAIARRSAVLEDGPGRLNVIRGVDELRERRNVSSSTEETPKLVRTPPQASRRRVRTYGGRDVAPVWREPTRTTYSCRKRIDYSHFSQFLEVASASSRGARVGPTGPLRPHVQLACCRSAF